MIFFYSSNTRPVPHSLLAVSGIYNDFRKKENFFCILHTHTHTHTHLFYCYIWYKKRENAYQSLLIRARGAAYVRRITTRVRNTSSYRLTGFHCRLWTVTDTYIYIYIYIYERCPIGTHEPFLVDDVEVSTVEIAMEKRHKPIIYTIHVITTVGKWLYSLNCNVFRKLFLLQFSYWHKL